MFEQIDKSLRDWVESTLGTVTLSFDRPNDSRTGRGVNLYLLELVDTPPLRSMKRPPLQLSLRYLVTTWADTAEEAHRLLGELVFAAMQHSPFEVELEALSAPLWRAFGVVPKPFFMLRVPLRKEQPEPASKLVRKPLVINTMRATQLQGVVLGPGDVPLAGAWVELPSLQYSTYTDAKGWFCFSSVPVEPVKKTSYIRAKSSELNVTVDQAAADGELVIHFNPFNVEE